MKKVLLLIPAIIISFTLSSYAPASTAKASIVQLPIPSSLDMNNALKQALQIGTSKSSDQLSALNGYLATPQ